MPCQDVTEILKIELDFQDRVHSYSLNKLTCGGVVGNPKLLENWLAKRLATDIIAETPTDFLKKISAQTILNEFMHLKHFLAVQSGLKVLLGNEAGGIKDHCTVIEISAGPQGIELTAEIKVDILTEKIPGCGNCASCGTKH